MKKETKILKDSHYITVEKKVIVVQINVTTIGKKVVAIETKVITIERKIRKRQQLNNN